MNISRGVFWCVENGVYLKKNVSMSIQRIKKKRGGVDTNCLTSTLLYKTVIRVNCVLIYLSFFKEFKVWNQMKHFIKEIIKR